MCGIAGAVDRGAATPEERLACLGAAMAAPLAHRGPDGTGTWTDPALGLTLGHRRLSVIELSDRGHQPMVSRSGRWVIAFNGEIYNFVELRAQLSRQGVRFRGSSDTEVLLEAIEQWGGVRALERVNGMFAFAVVDREQRTLTLARDRLGEKPFYYGAVGSWFTFGSELKALRAHPAFSADIDRDALSLFLRHNYVPAPHSIYTGIRKLPPGTTLTMALPNGEVGEPQPYWSLRTVVQRSSRSQVAVDEQQAVQAVDELLNDSVARRMLADVRLGAFLSGGIDSSLIVAAMQANSRHPIKTFTIGFEEADYDEATYARRVASHLGTDHTELYVTANEALAVIPTIPQLYDEPFADSSQIPTTLLSALARDHVTVALSGDGGDELFGGYTRYRMHADLWSRLDRMPPWFRRAAGASLRAVPAEGWDRAGSVLASLSPRRFGGIRVGDRVHKLADVLGADGWRAMYLQLMTHWPRPDELVRGATEPLTLLRRPEEWPDTQEPTEQLLYLDTLTYLPDDILVKVDRASMSRGLEVRVPLLDHRMVELAWQLPLALKMRADGGKWVLRQVLQRYVPRELVERPKMGFGVPIGAWLRGPLRAWAEELLSRRRLEDEGFFDPAPIRLAWREHLSGVRDWKYHLWDVLMFQAWYEEQRRQAVEPIGSTGSRS